MFGIEKKELEENLENLRKNICCYMGPTCDCKYGVEDRAKKDEILCASFVPYGGEHTGCPELRMVLRLLSVISEEDFNDYCAKARII